MTRKVYAREIYFYLICLVAIIIFIIGLVNLGDNAIGYFYPTTYVTRANMEPMYKEQYSDLNQEEIDKMIDEEIASSLKMERIIALKGLFRGALLVIIAIPLFIWHWRKAQAMWYMKTDSD